MTMQHEFCFFACLGKQSQHAASDDSEAFPTTYLSVKHFALGAQAITLGDQAINLLAPLKNTLNSLVKHNLGLIEFLLDLHDAVGGVRVLVLDNVLLELGEGQLCIRVCKGRARVSRQELVEDLGEQLVGDEGGILVVGDDDAGDALAAAVGVEGVALLFDVLAGSGSCAFGDGLAEEGHEFTHAVGCG